MSAKSQPSRVIVAENVRRIRESLGLSQSELARLSGVSQPKLCLLEKARHDPQCETIDKLADAVGVPASDLLKPNKKTKQRS